MVDMIFLELALALVIVAVLAAVATTSTSRTVRGIASKAVNGSFTAALVSGDDRLVLLLAAGIERLAWSVEGSDAVMVLPTLRDGRFAPSSG